MALLLSSPTARRLIAAGASLFFAASLVGLTSHYINIAETHRRQQLARHEDRRGNHVTVGYGGYGEASSLTWNTDGRVTVRPLMECQNPEGANICPFYIMTVPSWYRPLDRPHLPARRS
jgi:hypothetical protein